MSGKEYNGPEINEVYSDEDTFETFDDLDEELDELEEEQDEDEQQSATSHDSNEEEEENEEEKGEKAKKDARKKKDAAKKARGQKGDDMDALETEEENFDDLDEDEEEEKEVKDVKEEKEESDKEEEKVGSKDKDGKPKGKPTYVTVDGETYALDSNSIVSTTVDGKIEKVTIQELKNNYAGKVAYDKKFNEINLKEQAIKRTESEVTQKLGHFTKVKQQIEEIIKDPSKNPKDALKIFLDQSGVDSYDLMERMFKADLTELANVLNMEPAERKAYFLEKKNSHLLEQTKKRDEQRQSEQRVTSYTQKVNALRNSFGVSEAQYMDALEELKSYGTDEKEISEHDIVEWAATKPHRATVKTLLDPYIDHLPGNAYGKLAWDLANILREGSETPELIKKHLADVYGVPTEVRQLSKKLNPLGRKSKPLNKPQPSSKKRSYESFDDIDDE